MYGIVFGSSKFRRVRAHEVDVRIGLIVPRIPVTQSLNWRGENVGIPSKRMLHCAPPSGMA